MIRARTEEDYERLSLLVQMWQLKKNFLEMEVHISAQYLADLIPSEVYTRNMQLLAAMKYDAKLNKLGLDII